MIRAAIDIGSNSTLFLVARQDENGQWNLLEEDLIPNGLGWEMNTRSGLSDAMQLRNLDMVSTLIARAKTRGAAEIRAVGTAALRNAVNSGSFLQRVLNETGVKIRLISGQEEARLTFLGAMLDFQNHTEYCRVVDVGGGSSELVVGRGKQIQESVSIPLGAVSLTQQSIPSQPLSAEQSEELLHVVTIELEIIPKVIVEASGMVIAVGGTASTLAALTMGIDISTLWQRNPISISRSKVDKYWKTFASMAVKTIAQIPHLPPDRAGIITAGTAILLSIINRLQIDKIILSNKGLRWGLLIDDNI